MISSTTANAATTGTLERYRHTGRATGCGDSDATPASAINLRDHRYQANLDNANPAPAPRDATELGTLPAPPVGAGGLAS